MSLEGGPVVRDHVDGRDFPVLNDPVDARDHVDGYDFRVLDDHVNVRDHPERIVVY